jgi:hypothetical protein
VNRDQLAAAGAQPAVGRCRLTMARRIVTTLVRPPAPSPVHPRASRASGMDLGGGSPEQPIPPPPRRGRKHVGRGVSPGNRGRFLPAPGGATAVRGGEDWAGEDASVPRARQRKGAGGQV